MHLDHRCSSFAIPSLKNNAPVHTAQVAMVEAEKCSFDLFPHTPYSPDLAPSDFYLFPKLKSDMRIHHFQSDDDVTDAASEYLEGQEAASCSNRMPD